MEEDPEIVLNPILVSKIQNYMNGSIYRETIENAAAFNSRLSADRTQRLPFLDSQTGVAQNHSSLWMEERHRLPGFREGQVYTYPSKKWRKKRRQYLNNFMQPRYPPGGLPRKEIPDEPEPPVIAESLNISTGPSAPGEDVKEVVVKEDIRPPEAWYYDDLDIPDAGEFDEPDADSDYDYEESYSKRKKKKAPAKSTRQTSTRGRRKITYDAITDPEKPFSCDICGARYKTRPGLTYHYTHSHKDKEEEEEEDTVASKREDNAARRQNQRASNTSLPLPVLHPQHQQHPMQQLQPPTLQPQQPPPHHMMGMSMGSPQGGGGMMPLTHMTHHHPPPHLVPQQQPPHMMQNVPSPMLQRCSPPPILPVISNPGPSTTAPPNFEDPAHSVKKPLDNSKPRVQPSHYCDFCLGDAVENKKSGAPEELVSCSDCGRSGHPTCLQFTANMIISVKKYRWQCIECKCCSICGTSDNDDQLLFCDDCDRGYHMYCLSPPLMEPPPGSWSCTLCIAEFHTK